MDTVTGLNVVRDTLRTHLVDPYTIAGGNARGGSYWVFGNEPITSAKYPQIQLKKIDNPSEPISMGPNYMEHEQLFINIYFYNKNGFKITVDGTTYQNAQMTEYYLGLIKSTLKDNFMVMAEQCARGYKHINTTQIEYDPDTQLYYGAVTIRIRWFQR